MKISVITVCYNSALTLEQTIQSVLSQNYADKEYIIIDGASTDGSIEIINKYKDQIQYFVSEPDGGIYEAMNKGISASTGDVIGILNSDDLYKNANILQQISDRFSENVDAVCTDVEIFRGHPENVVRYYSCTKWKPWMFRVGHQPPHPGFFVRKNCYNKFGIFDTSYKIAADFDLLFRLIYKHKCNVLFLLGFCFCLQHPRCFL